MTKLQNELFKLFNELNFYTQELSKLQNEYIKKIISQDFHTSKHIEIYIYKCLSTIDEKQTEISFLIEDIK